MGSETTGRRSAPRVGALLLAGALLAGLVPLLPATASATPLRTVAPDVSEALLPPWMQGRPGAFAAPKVCGVKNQAVCGTIRVPLDRKRPGWKKIRIAYEHYVHRDQGLAEPVGTIVAVEGGPGYATLPGRGWYKGLFNPMLDSWDFLMIDLRGTGSSTAIDCPSLQDMDFPVTTPQYRKAVGVCGKELGRASSLYGTANAAADLVDVLDHLGLDKIALYGDSYGTYFSQTFALHHADRLSSLILDAAYPVTDGDPWWRDWSRAANDAVRYTCERDPHCTGDPVKRIQRLLKKIRKKPVSARVLDADGSPLRVTVNPGNVMTLLSDAGYDWDVYQDLDAAVRAALRGDMVPILRQIRLSWGEVEADMGPAKIYSAGLSYAVGCNDYPQLYDMNAPVAKRPKQYERSIKKLRKTDPKAFWPFTITESLTSPIEDYGSCIRWPVPKVKVPLLPKPVVYPDTPTLVLVGDLDSVTSPEGSRMVADDFPNSTYIEVPNGVHVVALGDQGGCIATIVRRFVADHDAGDTSCVADYIAPTKLVKDFPRKAKGFTGTARERSAQAAAGALADAIRMWPWMWGWDGVGLRGGTFSTRSLGAPKFTFYKTRFVEDLWVKGKGEWRRNNGAVTGNLRVGGPGGPGGKIKVSWNDDDPDPQMEVTGRLGGQAVHFFLPVP